MFEAYSVAVTLRLNNLISPQLMLLAKEFEKLEGLAVTLKSTFRKLGEEAPGLRAITTAVNSTNTSLERASRSAMGLQSHLAAARATAASMPPIIPHIGGGGPRLPGGGGAAPGGGGGGGRAGTGHGGAGGFHGGNIHMGPGGVGIGSVGMAAGDAFVPLAVTAGLIYGGHSLYESAKALNTEVTRFKLFGMGDKLNAEAQKFVAGMHVYGSTQTDNMRHFREAQGVFRESGLNDSSALEGAKLAAPFLAKIAFATEAMDDEAKGKLRTSGLSMLRWVEMSGGLKSPEKFKELANFGWKMTTTSGGAVDWEQLRQFSATAGNAGRFITPDGLAALEPLIGELKGGGAGTGLRTAANRLTGVVRLPNQAAHALVDNGIWDESKVEWNKNGGIKQFHGNPFKSYDEFVKAPAQWYEKFMLPVYEKMKLSQEERGRENSMIFGGTGGRLFTLIEQQMETSHRSVAAVHKSLGIDSSGDEAKKSLGGQEKEFSSAWTDFKTVFGTAALPMFTNMLVNGAAFLRGVSSFLENNAGLISALGTGLTQLNKLTLNGQLGALYDAGKGLLGGHAGGATGSWGGETMRGGAKAPIQVTSTTNLDGKVLAKTVTTHQAKDLSRPLTGPRTFDGSMSPQGTW
jgi:hypothetical protein